MEELVLSGIGCIGAAHSHGSRVRGVDGGSYPPAIHICSDVGEADTRAEGYECTPALFEW